MMRAATFGATGVELGGHNAPERDVSGPTAMPRSVLWTMVVVILGVCALIVIAVPLLMRSFLPDSQRIAVGDVSFIPALGWTQVANPTQAPADAVTVGKDSATFTVWTQPGADAGSVARQVTEAFFPAATDTGTLFHETVQGVVHVRPKQNSEALQISQVVVGPVDARSLLGVSDSSSYPGQLVVEVSAGPPPGPADKAGTLFRDVGMMAASVEAGRAS